MLLVGLTGGIGSGKSTVATLLAERGAVVVDADVAARQAIDPGTPGHAAVAERFGDGVLADDGSIDRAALARLVFTDERARKELEAIVHPEVFRILGETAAAHRDTDDVVVFDAPLIVEAGHADLFDVLILVTAPEEERVRRLVRSRDGMTEAAARERIAAQLPDDEKARLATHVIQNDGSPEDLRSAVDALWTQIQGRLRPDPGGGDGSGYGAGS